MRKTGWLSLALLLTLPLPGALAQGWRKDANDLKLVNEHLQGKVIDYTANHGVDNRFWSRAMYQRRDVYVYLPPGFDPHQQYPLMIWLHGWGQDEKAFLTEIVPYLDKAIATKCLPPLIAVAPDGSYTGEKHKCEAPTYFLNSRLGDYEDFVLQDLWDFVCAKYPISSNRGEHIVAGLSMGGFAAYNYAIKHRDIFGIVMGICPALNMRWMDCQGCYHANFDPSNWGWRTEVGHGCEPVARFGFGLVTVRLKHLIEPAFGLGPEAATEISRENPIELMDRCQLHEGELAMYIAYVGLDEYNIDAQVESFLYLAKHRGLSVAVDYSAFGRHHRGHHECMMHSMPGALTWLAQQLAAANPCGPNGCGPDGKCPVPPQRDPGPLPPRWR